LVNDDPKIREKVVTYLRNINSVDDMDLIIALGMAKEGFDWPYVSMLSLLDIEVHLLKSSKS